VNLCLNNDVVIFGNSWPHLLLLRAVLLDIVCVQRSTAMKMACQQCFKFSTLLAGSLTSLR